MSAPNSAKPIGKPEGNEPLPTFTCQGCNHHGKGEELLGVDPDEDATMWCPICGTSGWIWD